MTSLPIGEWALKGIGLEEAGMLVNKGIKAEAKPFMAQLQRLSKEVAKTPGNYQKIFTIGKTIGTAVGNKLKNVDGYIAAMASEGTEEITEQFMQDGITNIYNGLSTLGLTSTNKKDKFTYGSSSDILANYAMNFFGGAAGGAMFRFKDQMSNRGRSDDESTKDIYWLIRNGYKSKLDDETNRLIKKGYFGSSTLSDQQITVDIPGLGRKVVFKPKSAGDLSQNDAIGGILLNSYNNIEQQIFQEGLSPDSQITALLDARYDLIVKDLKVNSPLYEDFDRITGDILTINNEISKILETSSVIGAPIEVVNTAKQAIQKKEIELALKREELKTITSGEAFPEYQAKALFNMSAVFNGPFGNKNRENIAKSKYNKSFKSLSPEQKVDIEADYKIYKEANQKDALKTGYKEFVYLNQKVSPHIAELAKYAGQRAGHYTLVDELGTASKFNLQANTLGQINKAKTYLNKTLTVSDSLNKVIQGEKDVKSVLKAADDILTFVTNPSIDKFDKSFVEEMRGVFNAASLRELGGEDMSLINIVRGDSYFERLGLDGMDEMTIDDLIDENNITSIKTKLESLRTTLGPDAEVTIAKIENYIFNDVGVSKLNNQKQLFEGTVGNRTINTLNELLAKFELIQNGTTSDIIKVLTNEFETLGKIQNITDYQINNPEIQDNLEDAQVLIQQLQAIVLASTDYNNKKHGVSGYNTIINNTFPESKLATITQEQSSIILAELQQIDNKIELFLRLSLYNRESKIKNLIADGVNMETLFYEQFKEGDFRKLLEEVKIEDEEFITPELIKSIEEDAVILQKSLIIKQTKIGDPLNNIEIHELEKEKLGIQKVFYERIQELSKKYTPEVVQDAIFNNTVAKRIFPVEALSNPSTTDFSVTQTVIHPYTLFVWANTLMTVDPAELYTELRGTEIGEGKYDGIEQAKFVPFYAQEAGIKVALGMLSNKGWINRSMVLLGGKDIEGTYMGKINETFNNLVFIDGVPGSGKTTAIGYTIARILKRRGLSFWTAGPYTEQAKQLEESTENTDKGVSFTKETLLKKFFTDAALEEIAKVNEKTSTITDINTVTNSINEENALISIARVDTKIDGRAFGKIKVSNIDASSFLPVNIADMPAVIFIDELTHFSIIELEALRQAFIRMGEFAPIIIGYGDTMQNGFMIAGDPHNIDGFRRWDTPKLSASLRTSSDLKNNNLIDIRARYNLIAIEYNKIITGETSSYDLVKNAINKLHNSQDDSTWFKLRQFTDEKGVVYGEKVSSLDESIAGLKKLLLSTSEKIGFITDNKTNTNKILNSFTPEEQKRFEIKSIDEVQKRLDIKTLEKVQGLEYDHVIIDVDWSSLSKDRNYGPLNFISNIYTLTTRSRIGTIIVDKGFTTNDNLIIKQINSKQVIDIKLDKKLLDQYKATRVKEIVDIANLFEPSSTKITMPLLNTIVPKSETQEFALEIMNQEAIGEMAAASGKQPILKRIVLTGDLQDNSLYTYPYYERVGVDYEDAYLFPDVDGKPNTKPLFDIKNLVFYGRTPDEIQTYLEEAGIENISALKVVVRASYYKIATDRDQIAVKTNQVDTFKELSEGSAKVKGAPFLRTALKIERVDPATQSSLEPLYITLGVFASSKSTETHQIPGLITNLENLTDKVKKVLIENNGKPIDLEINSKDPFSILRYTTKIQLRYLNDPIPFSEFKNELHNVAVVSPIYIFTGKDSSSVGTAESGIVDAWVKSKKLAGKAITFVSFNKDLSESQLKEIFVRELLSGARVPTVRVVLLNTKGTKAKAWFEKSWNTIADNLIKNKADRYPIGTLASQKTAVLIVNAIASIADSDKYKGNKTAIKDIANELIKRLGPDGMKLVHFDKDNVTVAGYDENSIIPKGQQEILSKYIRLKPKTGIIKAKDKVAPLELVVFPHNHTYRLLIGLGIAMNGGVDITTKGESGIVFESIDKYNKNYGDFLNELYNVLDEQFPNGIYAHPVYQASGQRTDEDYVQLAMENYEDFEVDILPTLPDALIDLRLVSTSTEMKEQTNIKKKQDTIDLATFLQSKANLITDPDKLVSFNAQADEIMNSFIDDIETDPLVIKSKLLALYADTNIVTFTKIDMLKQLRVQTWINADVSIEDALNSENDIINKGLGIFVISGNNAKFDFEINYNMNEVNPEKRMIIETNPVPVEDIVVVDKLITDTKQMLAEFHAENIELMIPGVMETVLAALDSKTREIIPGSPTQIAFTQLAALTITLGENKLYEALLDYTNTQNIKACNS